MSAALPPVSASTAPRRAQRVRLRRAVMLLLMTVVVPGSAQVAAGNKRVGRFAMRAFAAAVIFVLAVVVTAFVSRDRAIILFTNVWFLGLLRFGLIAYAIGWAYLLIDAWRIADPLGLRQLPRLAMTGLNGVVVFSLTGVLLYASSMVAVERDFLQTVFPSHWVSDAAAGRYNILLMGGDAGPDRVGLRPDSMTVVSVDQQTGRTILFSLPRNLAHVPFPKGTVMHKQFPNGFTWHDCLDECMLNAVNTWANDHASLFPGVKDPGVLATTQAIEAVTGLHINYYVLVDLHGFSALVDALGGIHMNVHQEVPIGGVGGAITGYIKPGKQTLNGYQTLWYSRSRAWSSDYSRMARQKCVMNAMLHQLNPETVLTKFSAIASAGKEILQTSIPASEIHTFVGLAEKARSLPVQTVSFVPPKIDDGNPDFGLIHTMVKQAIAKSQAKGTSKAVGHPAKPPSTLGNKDSYQESYAANDTSNLSSSC